ncbi:MAG: substrate-binding domain-containing protein [Limnochordia bacterium]|jgi:tungstate transport system substrate-binding protein
MRKLSVFLLVLTVLLGAFVGVVAAEKSLVLATTTSTYDSGLLHHLLPKFEAETGIKVEVISVGTGQAIQTGRSGDCDIILVHARAQEDQFVADGFGSRRWDVMYNDFVYLGPVGDPAGLRNSKDLADAIEKMIAHMEDANINFLSRGDNSGTHSKELAVWKAAGIEDVKSYSWYLSLGQGMGNTLIAANEMRGYVLTDRGTYLAMKDKLPFLEIVFEGDANLSNPYGIIPVNPEVHPHVKYDEALQLVDFFISDEVQAMIGEFGVDKYGQPLFFPNAQ